MTHENFISKALSYSEPVASGSTTQFLHLLSDSINTSTLSDNSLVVRFLAAPVNPVDLLVLAGKYPVKPRFRIGNSSIAGYDGIAEVVWVGSAASSFFRVGDRVLPRAHGFGTGARRESAGAGRVLAALA